MRATTRSTTSRRPARGALAVLALGATVLATGVSQATASDATADARADCRQTSYDGRAYVECDIHGSGHVDIVEWMPPIWHNIGPDTPVTVTAWGGSGGGRSGRTADRGRGGVARTVVTYADVEQGVYVYNGRTGAGLYSGGSSTIVKKTPLDDVRPLHTDLIAVAGGGGAQGELRTGVFEYVCGGGHGGHGAIADAAGEGGGPLYLLAQGGRGGTGSWSDFFCGNRLGAPGGGGDATIGGAQPLNRDLDGEGGLGGHGAADVGWADGLFADWTKGSGGGDGDQPGGGGGFGGGAAGVYGGGGGGGGGGGSYALNPTAQAPVLPSLPSDPPSQTARVTIAFPQDHADGEWSVDADASSVTGRTPNTGSAQGSVVLAHDQQFPTGSLGDGVRLEWQGEDQTARLNVLWLTFWIADDGSLQNITVIAMLTTSTPDGSDSRMLYDASGAFDYATGRLSIDLFADAGDHEATIVFE